MPSTYVAFIRMLVYSWEVMGRYFFGLVSDLTVSVVLFSLSTDASPCTRHYVDQTSRISRNELNINDRSR